jgi:hypothetical protein
MKNTAPPGAGWHVASERLVLRGAPPRLKGDLALVNESDEKLRVRTLAVRATPSAPDATSPYAESGREQEAANRRMRAPVLASNASLQLGVRLAPRDTAHVRASLTIDPHTPPGRYLVDAEGFAAGGVELEVLERLAIELSPPRLELRGAPGEELAASLVAYNRGNVPVAIPELALVHLEERFWMGRSLVHVLREAGRDTTHQAFLDRLLGELKATDTRPMRVEVKEGGATLDPGKALTLHLRMQLPEELHKGRDYVRSISFMHARLFVAVTCDAAADSTKRRAR